MGYRSKTGVFCSAVLLAVSGVVSAALPIPAPPAASYTCAFYSPSLDLSGMMVFSSQPSPLGPLKLDGRGGYTSGKERGQYAVSPTAGTLMFKTGVLKNYAGTYRYTDTGFEARYELQLKRKDSKSYSYTACDLKGRSRGVQQSNAQGGASSPSPSAGAAATRQQPNPGLRGTLVFGSPVKQLDLATGKVKTLFDGFHASFTPSGDVLYASGQEIRLGQLSGTSKRLFTVTLENSGDEFFFPALSPSGRLVAVAYGTNDAYPSGVQVYSLAGAVVAAFPGMHGPSWTPDARLVMARNAMFEGVKPGLVITTPDLKGTRPIAVQTPAAASPVVSPNGKKLAFVSHAEVWTVNLDGSDLSRRAVFTGAVGRVAWAPDSQTLLFADTQYAVLYVVRPGKLPTPLLDSEGDKLQSAGGGLSWR